MEIKAKHGAKRLHVLTRNAKLVAAAEARSDGGRDWLIDGVRGLILRCPAKRDQLKDSAVWYLRYQAGTGARRVQRMMKIAKRADITLADAIAKADELRGTIALGADPAADRQASRVALSFCDLAERLLASGRLADTTARVYRNALDNDVIPAIGKKAASEVTADDVVLILRKIEKRGSATQADHTRAAISSVFGWGVRERFVKTNPCRDVPKRSPTVARSRTPSDGELAALWKGAGTAKKLSIPMRLIIRLAILTGQRRTEVAGAQLSELVDLQGSAPLWIIPGDQRQRGKITKGRTKNKRDQILPLSRQAAALFGEALAGVRGAHVFPADIRKVKLGKKPRVPHIHGDSVTRAMIYLRSEVGVEDISVHDMRRAISNWLKDQGVSREVRDLILNHKDQSVTEAHYTQTARMEKQVREAMQMWADHVDTLLLK